MGDIDAVVDMGLLRSVIVNDLHVFWPGRGPPEADAPLLVHPHAVLSDAIATEFLQPITGWHPEIVQNVSRVQDQ
jgi:hypothetical protein